MKSEVQRLRAENAQLRQRLRRYEPVFVDAGESEGDPKSISESIFHSQAKSSTQLPQPQPQSLVKDKFMAYRMPLKGQGGAVLESPTLMALRPLHRPGDASVPDRMRKASLPPSAATLA